MRTIGLLCCLIGLSALAQASKMAKLDEDIKKQEAVVKELQAGFQKEYGELEKDIKDLVDIAASVRDTSDSRSKGVSIKEDVIKELKETIKFYQTEQNRIKNRYKTERKLEVKEVWQKQIENVDKEINKRIDEILKIIASLSSYPERRHDEDNSVSHRAAVKADRLGRDAMRKLDKNKGKLEDDLAALQRQLNRAKTDNERAKIEKQIAACKAQIAERDRQMKTAMTKTGGGNRPLSKRTASDMSRRVRKMVKDLNANYSDVLRTKKKVDAAKVKLAELQRQKRRAQK